MPAEQQPLNDHAGRDELERRIRAGIRERRLGVMPAGEPDEAAPLEPDVRGIADHDQVPRKLAYEATHPGVRFRPPCVHDHMWTAELDDGDVEVRALQLRLLLDRLNAPGT